MASARKKQDEKNLKILRELVSLPHNKYCFDCNQRGPTYVNVTIGSFVCTKCSGMLRGLTPPHRVKSISMATFTSQEIDFIRTRGNDYCRKTYLGLYEGSLPSETRDEQQIHDLMVNKYERKRFFMEPSMITKNGHVQQQNAININKVPKMDPPFPIISDSKPTRLNIVAHNDNKMQTTTKNPEFVADFASADIFNSANNNTAEAGFANFDNNPIFNNSNSMPQIATQNQFSQPQNNVNGFKVGPPAPSEDRYAALKDLDNALKAQPAFDWNSGPSTPASSLYSSPSPQSSMYGSPSQTSQFSTIFSQEPPNNNISNPFNNGSLWNTNGISQQQPISNGAFTNNANPFKTPEVFKTDPFKVDPFKVNGCNQDFQTLAYTQPVNGTNWMPNPFKLGATSNGHSNNPFL